MSVCDRTEVQLQSHGVRAGRLRQAILRCAFEGKLVLQDPNDKPASALLERIMAERAALEAQRKQFRVAREL